MLHFGKIFTALCGMILAVCLAFSIIALTSLRSAVQETDELRVRAETLLEEVRRTGAEARAVQARESDTQPPVGAETPEGSDPAEAAEAVAADVLYHSFEVRESDGKIAIFDADGSLLRMLEVPVCTLPSCDRDALAAGIPVRSWRELQSLIEDFGG